MTATLRISNGITESVMPVSTYKNIKELRFSAECLLHLYAGSAKEEVIKTELSLPDGSVEEGRYHCHEGRLVPIRAAIF